MLPLTQKSRQQGQALVEFSLILPLLLFITIGIIEFGRAFFSYVQVTNLHRQALRLASTVGSTGQTYVNCPLMRTTIEDGVFFGEATATIYYLDYEDWDGAQFTAVLPADGNCDTAGEVSPAQLANGDLLAIDVDYTLEFMTPIFTQTFSFDIYGQRTIVRTIDLTGVPFCGDLICNGDEQGTDPSNTATYCEDDCVPGTGGPPTITTITDDTPTTINNNDQVSNTIVLVLNGTDPEDPAFSFDVTVLVGGTTVYDMIWDGVTAPTGYKYTLDTTAFPHGSFLTLDFQAQDGQNNSSSVVRRTVEIYNPPIDTDPTISVVSPPDPATLSGTYLVQLDADDLETSPAGLTVQFMVNTLLASDLTALTYNPGTGYFEGSWDTAAGSYPDGTYAITASVNDGVNATVTSTAFNIQIDNSSPPGAAFPVISTVTPDGSEPVNASVAVQMIASDDVTPTDSLNAAVNIDSTGWTALTWNAGGGYFELPGDWDTTATPNGTHTLQFRVTDGNGNTTYHAPVFVEVVNPLELHVYSLSDAPVNTPPTWATTITITVVDQNDVAVPDVQVFGYWGNGYAGSASCTTNGSGQCTVDATNIVEGAPNVKFTVVDLSKPGTGISYDSSANVVTVITSNNPPPAP